MKRALLFALLGLSPAAAWASPKASYQHYLKALLYANQGDPAQALREYDAAIELDPQSASMRQQAAELALESGNMEKAASLAEGFVALAPNDPQAYLLLGNVRWARGELPQAQAAFEKALAIKPDFRDALLALGNLLGAQSPDKARKYLKQYLATNPDNAAEAEYQLAMIEQKAGDNAAAVAHLKAANRLDPDNVQPLLALAQVYEVAGDTLAALGAYEDVLKRDPRNAALLDRVGELRYSRGELAEAKELFQRAREAAPGNPAACLWLALIAEQEGDFAAAAASLKASAALKEDSAVSLRLSYYLTQAGQLREAVQTLEAARAKWPDSEDVAYFLALGYDDLKEPAKAAALLSELVSRRPGNRDARFQLGAVYEKLGDMPRAEEQFRAILKANPDDASALNFLGYALAERGLKLDQAEKLTRRASELDPKSGAYVDSYGWTLFKLGKIAEARERLELAGRLLPDDETVWDHVGEVCRAAGDHEGAWKAWRRSFSAEPAKAVRDKLLAEERRLDAARLGELYLESLAAERGAFSGFGGPCQIDGSVAGREFRFGGILHYRAAEGLSIEVLGPLFTPLFRIAVDSSGGFVMDPIRLEGVDERALQGHLQGVLLLLRDYLSGQVFAARPARFHGGWKGPRVEAGRWMLRLDKATGRLARVQEPEGGYQLELGDYRASGPRAVPAEYRLEGR
ncbi:MAG TPA: tetratricopeptide repeat protein, partial [Elusimicrobiota bacterium]|nr:tetratricopeptide repeat protein [Elusimicrobiota bacterium]